MQVPFDLVPILRLAQVGQQMAQPVVTEIQRLDDLRSEAAQGVLHALDIHFDRDLPVIAFCENMRQPNDRRPPPTQPPLLPMARDMPVQDLRQAHRDHLTDKECHIVDALRDDHQVILPQKFIRLLTQLYSHGVLSSLRVELIPEDNNLTQGCIALPLWTSENLVQIQRWDFFYGEWGVSFILYSYTSILQTQFSYGEGHEASRIGSEAMPLDQHIEGGHGEREPRLKIRPHAAHDVLEVADERQHREHRLHEHTVFPHATWAQFEVGRIALRGMEGGIAQDDHASVDVANQPLQGVIDDMGRGTVPPYHQAILGQQQTEFASDNPAMVGQTFAPHLLRTAAFAHRVDQLDPIRVDDAEHGRSGQEELRPVLMGREETKEPRTLREPGKQRSIVFCQPAIEGTIPPAL